MLIPPYVLDDFYYIIWHIISFESKLFYPQVKASYIFPEDVYKTQSELRLTKLFIPDE